MFPLRGARPPGWLQRYGSGGPHGWGAAFGRLGTRVYGIGFRV